MKPYRQLIIGLAIGLAVAALFFAPTFAGAAGNVVGVIDLEKAVLAHPAYESKMAAFEDFKDQQDARLDAYRNKDVLTEEDKQAIVDLRLDIDDKVAQKYEELFNSLTDDVINAVEKVGRESGIEVIIEAQAVLYGGLDLTPAVINALGG
jgi:outer membrane protein